MAAIMRENDRGAPVVELEFRKTLTTVGRAAYVTKPSPVKEKPPEWRYYNYTSNCIALDRLVEVALSPTGTLSEDSSFRTNAKTPKTKPLVPSNFYPSSRDGSRDGGEDDGDSAEMRRDCSNGIKVARPAAPSPSPSSPSPSSEAPNHHHSAGYFQQQQQEQQEQQKLNLRRLSSFNEISTPAGRSSSSSLRVHVQHPHAKRLKLTPRFKALVDISC